LVINRLVVGGAETVALDVARSLDPERFQTRILATAEPAAGPMSEMRRRCEESGVPVTSMGLTSYADPRSLWKLTRFFKKHACDVVHGHSRFADLWAARTAAWARVPAIYWTRHLVYDDMSAHQIQRYRSASSKVRRIFAVSETVRRYCLETEGIPANKVQTLVNGIDTQRFRPLTSEAREAKRRSLGLKDDDLMLLFVGRMADQKAPEAFIRAVTGLSAPGRRIVSFICGAGPREEEIRNVAAAATAEVRHLGLRKDIPEMLASADLFVSTSRSEGLPLNVMEAMACGTAIVAPGLSQIRELMDDSMQRDCLYQTLPETGYVPEGVTSACRQRMATLLNAPETRRSLGTRGRERIVNDFSLSAHVSKQAEIYASDLARDA